MVFLFLCLYLSAQRYYLKDAVYNLDPLNSSWKYYDIDQSLDQQNIALEKGDTIHFKLNFNKSDLVMGLDNLAIKLTRLEGFGSMIHL